MDLQAKLLQLEAKSQSFEGMVNAGTLLSEEQVTEFDNTVKEINSINKQLDIVKRSSEARAVSTAPTNQLPQTIGGQDNQQTERKALIQRASVGAKVDHWEGANREEKAANAYAFGMWAISLLGADKLGQLATKAQRYCDEQGITKAYVERDNETGGFLVPNQFSSTIIDLRNQYGQFRRFAQVFPMSSDTASVPRRSSGTTAYWVGESAAITESTGGWDQVNLVAKKLACLSVISSELSEDAVIDIANYVANDFAYQFAYAEDLAGFTGDGASTYGGIVGVAPKLKALSSTIANIAGLKVATGNLFSEFTLADFRAVIAKLPTYANAGAEWFVHRTLYYETMVGLAEAAGGTTATEIINGTRRDMFMGYPVNLIEVMPSTDANSQVCALFGNLRLAAMMGDRRRVTVTRSDQYRFAYDDLALKATQRIDINVHSVGNASATASARVAGPVVGLISAAS